jgi:hypothetical protein
MIIWAQKWTVEVVMCENRILHLRKEKQIAEGLLKDD